MTYLYISESIATHFGDCVILDFYKYIMSKVRITVTHFISTYCFYESSATGFEQLWYVSEIGVSGNTVIIIGF